MARITRGKVYQRVVNGKPSKYYSGQYIINGKKFRVVLLDENGNKITDQRKAEAALQKLIAPTQFSTEADRRAAHAEALKLAEVKLAEAEAEAEARENARAKIAAERKALKIADAWKKFTDPDERLAPECSARNLSNYRGYWQRFSDWLAEQPEQPELMRDVTETLAKRFANHLEETAASGNTFNKYRAFLLSFFNALAKHIRGGDNPFDAIRRKEKVKAAKRRDLTAEELRTVLSNADGELALLLWIGATTGLRLGDAATLRWSAIDLHRGIIRLDTRKTDTDVVIGIIPVLAELLERMPPEGRQGYLLPTLATQYLNLKQRTHMVARIQRYFTACGIEIHRVGTGAGTGKRAVTEVGFHSLRHSFATICGNAGTAESVTQRLLGHSRAAMTHYYQHSTESAATDTAKRLDGMFRGLLADHDEEPSVDVEAIPAEVDRESQSERECILSELNRLPTDELQKLLNIIKTGRE